MRPDIFLSSSSSRPTRCVHAPTRPSTRRLITISRAWPFGGHFAVRRATEPIRFDPSILCSDVFECQRIWIWWCVPFLFESLRWRFLDFVGDKNWKMKNGGRNIERGGDNWMFCRYNDIWKMKKGIVFSSSVIKGGEIKSVVWLEAVYRLLDANFPLFRQ